MGTIEKYILNILLMINQGTTYRMELRLGQQPNSVRVNTFGNTKERILLAGPWVGEFGWELCAWQGYVRRLSKQYNKTIVLSRAGREFLYEDFCDEFIIFDSPLSKVNGPYGETNQIKLNEILKTVHHTRHLSSFCIINPVSFNLNKSIIGTEFNKQDFIKYSSNTINKQYDILIHPRNKIVGGIRNWNIDNYNKLVLLLKEDYSVAEIGTDEAFKLDDIDDYRNISLRDTVSLMNRTKLVVGGASGPIHLASLCGAPHFLWSEEYSRPRFTTHWNPHNAKMFFHLITHWNPTVDEIYNGIIKSIKVL